LADESFRRGVRLGVDWGKARVGVAACDADGLLAYPVETVPARDQQAALQRVAALAAEYQPLEIIVGWPLALDGGVALAAQSVQLVAVSLAALVDAPVRLVDERLTTAQAHHELERLDTRKRRKVVDQAAAVGILEGSLNQERNTGTPPGLLIDVPGRKGKRD